MNFNIFATAASLIAGLIYFLPGEILYGLMRGNLPGPVTIALYFLGLALCVFIVIFLLSKILGNYAYIHYTFNRLIATVLILTIIGVPLVSAGCEFLYELGIGAVAQPKNFVFLIDDSGSMTGPSGNDPTNQRFDVVEQVANSLPPDSTVGIYIFADSTEAIYPVGTAYPGSISVPSDAVYQIGSGTALYDCISTVAKDLTPEMTKSATKFIILTDGDPTTGGYRTAIETCNQKNIALSCVGFGNYRRSTFEDLANRTGGNFMAADDASQLLTSVTEVINKNPVNRDLVSSRNDATTNSILYAILRVLFLGIIGLVFAYVKYLNAGLTKFSIGFFFACFAASMLGGILLEVFYQAYILDTVGRFVLCLLFAFTPLLSNSYYSGISTGTKTTYTPSGSSGNLYGSSSYSAGSGKNYF